MAERPAFTTLKLTDPRKKHPTVGWLQNLINESKFVKPKLVVDNCFGPDTAAETEELLYRLGHSKPKGAVGPKDVEILWRWDSGDSTLPYVWQHNRNARENEGFRQGWGITKRSWEGLHPGEFPPGGADLVPILPLAGASWRSYGYGDPEGQGGKHLAVDWFAAHGVPARSAVGGKIVRLSPWNKMGSGQVFGGVLSVRHDDGKLFVMRHINPLPSVAVGQRLETGQHVGTPTDWRDGADHIHFEVYKAGCSDREYGPKFALNPTDLYRAAGLIP